LCAAAALLLATLSPPAPALAAVAKPAVEEEDGVSRRWYLCVWKREKERERERDRERERKRDIV